MLDPWISTRFRRIRGEREKVHFVHLTITVSDITKTVSFDIGGVITDVATGNRGKETINGALVEVSQNYFAICNKTNTVFYFGEQDIYEDGQIIDHAGSWEAGFDGAMPGIVMPGVMLLGGKYFQEVAPNVAMDGPEIISMSEEVTTPAGTFKNCLETKNPRPWKEARDTNTSTRNWTHQRW